MLLQGWVLPWQVEAISPVLGTLSPSDLILVNLHYIPAVVSWLGQLLPLPSAELFKPLSVATDRRH